MAPSRSAYWPWIILGDRLVVSHTLAPGGAEPLTFRQGGFTVRAEGVEL